MLLDVAISWQTHVRPTVQMSSPVMYHIWLGRDEIKHHFVDPWSLSVLKHRQFDHLVMHRIQNENMSQNIPKDVPFNGGVLK